MTKLLGEEPDLLQLREHPEGFSIYVAGTEVVRHTRDKPFFEIGQGTIRVHAHGAFYDIKDTAAWNAPLGDWSIEGNCVFLSSSDHAEVEVRLTVENGRIQVSGTLGSANRMRIRLTAESGEHVFGCGEQFSYLDLKGRRFPLWVAEPGVGRDPESELGKRLADRHGIGGDYWTTYYPQPTFLSSRHYALHVSSSAYSVFDFTDDNEHWLEFFDIPDCLEFFGSDSMAGLVTLLSDRLGRQPQLPEWATAGAIIGLKDGEASFERFERIVASGAAVSGLWCEDWAGIRQTDFGRRLFWDWHASSERYPRLRERIAELASRGIAFLAYINPYLAVDGQFFSEAAELGHLVKRPDCDEPYVTDFGGFSCGHIDLTSRDACAWFGERLIGREMLDVGISGWMADFGEYLPVDARLADGSDALTAHNRWPVLWAKLNAEALASRNRSGDALFFMRSGFSEISKYCPLLWAGDQLVDFSRHDGIGTTITAALSAGLVGNAYHHSDIGGYTSILGRVRSADLLMRWIELSAFTPVMRSHEGNRPEENLQIDSNVELLTHFARMSRVHAALAPYTRAMSEQAEATGLPLQRPLFLGFEEDNRCFGVQDQYLYGSDLLVAPVLHENARVRSLYLPMGAEWVNFWDRRLFCGGQQVEVASAYGAPPVFYRRNSRYESVFLNAAAAAGQNTELARA